MTTTEKRVLDESKSIQEVPVVILDIEGTTTSISFVKDTLFPYVRENLEKYIKDHWADEEFKTVLEQLIAQAEKDVEAKVEGVVELKKAEEDTEKAQKAVVANVLRQMDSDRKTASLKLLQGHIYREGYKSGDLKGHIFEDVAAALKKWKTGGKDVYIYSSGSVEAQKLLFGNTTEGDLLEFLAGHFDTEVGAKGESQSYKNIAEKVGKKPEEMVFYTDILKEAEAAKEAGMLAVLMKRDGNAEFGDEVKGMFSILTSLLPEEEEEEEASPAKKVKLDKEGDVEMEDVEEKKEETPVETKAEEEKKPKEPEISKPEEEVVKPEEAPKPTEDEKMEAEATKTETEEKEKPVVEEVPKVVEALEAPPKVEALEAPPKVEAIEHKPEEAKEKPAEVKSAETNGTHENGVNDKTEEKANGHGVSEKSNGTHEEEKTNGTSDDKTNGTSDDKTNGTSDDKTNGTSDDKTNGASDEKTEEVVKSPTKKVVTDAAGDAPEVTAAE